MANLPYLFSSDFIGCNLFEISQDILANLPMMGHRGNKGLIGFKRRALGT